MPTNKVIVVKETPITVIEVNQQDYISLTDMVKPFGDEINIYNWLRNRNTIEFLGIWELIYNPDFNPIEFDRVKKQAGLNSFALSPRKWVDCQLGRRSSIVGQLTSAVSRFTSITHSPCLNLGFF
jgi:hypothetical protein